MTTTYASVYEKVFHKGETPTGYDLAILYDHNESVAAMAAKHRGNQGDSPAEVLADCVAMGLEAVVIPMQAEIKALRVELNELRRQLAESGSKGWVGIWSKDTEYAVGSIVTHGGAGWACVAADNKGLTPGASPSFWKLAIKSGRDGRDCRCAK